MNYQNVGTNIDCTRASALRTAAFEVRISINEASVVTRTQAARSPREVAVSGVPFVSDRRNTAASKDGQTTQFTAATDRVSGEVVRVEVKLKVVK